jgi:pimeloyl-ACP methyl ester carboxylesterase
VAAAVSSVSAVAVGGVTALGAAAYFARKVLTPDRQRPDDTQILGVGDSSVVLDLTPDTLMPGRYGLWLDGAAGHVRLGDVLDVDEDRGRVRRAVDGVDYGHLAPGFARWNQYYFAGPPDRALGLRTDYVDVDTELGTMPAWVVPAPAASDRWAVLVHGRGARRDEGLRAVRRGARDIVLVGWSMGGAIVLQTHSRSWLADHVSTVVLDAPVIDWGDVLVHHARAHGIPAPIGGLSRALMGQRSARRLVGVHDPVDVAKTNWVARSNELAHPTLLIHSVDDEFVPVGPSQELAAARPDLVTMEHWDTARHTKEWNVDPERWERSVAEFVSS